MNHLPNETTGGCLCGAVRYVVRGPLCDISICHCAMCRRLTTEVGAFTAAAPGNVEISGGGKLRWYRSSPEARRGFCGKCGANLFWEPAHGRHLSISAGSLDDASGLAIGRHIFVAGDETGGA